MSRRTRFETYSVFSCADESDRYAPFVKTGNAALKVLKSLRVHEFRSASSLKILFHSDPKEIVTAHGPPDGDSRRKPDIGIVSLAAAQRVRKPTNIDLGWDELVEHQAPLHPFLPFEWDHFLSSGEFKLQKPSLDPTPISYAERSLPVPHKVNLREKVERNEVSTPKRHSVDKRKREGTV